MIKGKNRPIGIFDSGVGGLTVVKSVLKSLPGEDVIYFGDTARVPYGNKSRGTVVMFSTEIMDFLSKKNVKMVVVACNTASSLSLKYIKKCYNIPVIGVISPGVREALRISDSKRIGVIGTKSTVGSRAYERDLIKRDAECRVFSKACPLFVPLVENKHLKDKITFEIAENYLKTFKKNRIDTLILGCTHYPLLKNVLEKVMKGVRLVDSPSAVVKEMISVMSQEDIVSGRKRKQGKLKCYVSDDPEGFRKTAAIFLRQPIKVSKAVL